MVKLERALGKHSPVRNANLLIAEIADRQKQYFVFPLATGCRGSGAGRT